MTQTENPEVQVQEQPFDAAEFLKARNAEDTARREGRPVPGKPETKEAPAETKPKEGETKPAKVETKAPDEETAAPRLSRSQRRIERNLERQIGELQGRLKAYEELGKKPVAAAPAEDVEPQRGDFADDASYLRAAAKWDKRQEEAKKAASDTAAEEARQYRDHIAKMGEKFKEDVKAFPDWEAVQAKAIENEDVVFEPAEHPVLMGLISTSDMQAATLYYLAQNPDQMTNLLELSSSEDSNALIRQFSRIEGRAEKLYSVEQQEKKAAQASEELKTPEKDRTHPAEAKAKEPEAGRTSTAERDAQKPRPTREVEARGGSAPPDDPPIGSVAWMERRNQAQFGR